MTNNTATLLDVDTDTTTVETPGVDFEVITAEDVADAMLTAALAEEKAREAVEISDAAFRASIATTVLGARNGLSDKAMADAVKAVKDNAPRGLHSLLYSSPTSVGYHRRTGLFFALPGDEPADITNARDVQTKIKTKGLSAKDVDLILGASADKSAAWAALCEAADAATATLAAKNVADEDEDGADEDDAPVVKDAAHYLRSVQGAIGKAVTLEPSMWTAEGVDLAQAIIDNLSGVLADLTVSAAARAVLADVDAA